MDYNEDTATDAVLASFEETTDPRLRAFLRLLVPHLHDLVFEFRPTLAEWEYAIEFLTRIGQKCDDTRQEFVLLSDVLGVSMLTETINGQQEGTESTVLGPFHMVASPQRKNGESIDLLGGARPCVIDATVLSTDGKPLVDAEVDVWQCTEDGFYDVQQPGIQPPGNGRGLFRTGEGGRFWFRTVVPSHYPIPQDGPVGELLKATGRHPYRPAHVHFIAKAEGHRALTTHLFVAGSPYIDSDAVFAVRKSLLTDFTESRDEDLARQYGVTVPFVLATPRIVIEPEEGDGSG
ncbi:6-chlorohydroxyquinol-1,2-dioxygenase [Amycolatopsis acidicola]|uniref:6-chlorohydroxyquinol-1,2-dioxygenase n=1 Tax=Amycolatopsis acidicola TaxID=2596893 RepID=A0A5N0V4J5_9PSEU|nr:dioxygenase [Amycolatopsis acidicola]KAA9160714.1 6-chlorohydroxyquinol-1,2-dioxygenase [Amycolatopsis acidicola]